MKTLILMKWRKSEIYKTEIKKSKYFIAKQNTKKIRLNSKQTPKTKYKRKNRDSRRK